MTSRVTRKFEEGLRLNRPPRVSGQAAGEHKPQPYSARSRAMILKRGRLTFSSGVLVKNRRVVGPGFWWTAILLRHHFTETDNFSAIHRQLGLSIALVCEVGYATLAAMSKLNVPISGSGIAGSVFAFWLLRADPNANITIVERDPALRLTGASVDIRSSAVDIIKWMGVEQEIRNQSTNEEGMQVVDANGKAVATLRATGNSDQVKLIFDESIDHFERNKDGVIITFSKSKEVKMYDLLVAADGLGSKIRGMMLDSDAREQLYNEGIYLAYFTIKSDLLNGSRLATGLNATGGRAIYLRPVPNPAGRTRGMLMVVTASGDIKTSLAIIGGYVLAGELLSHPDDIKAALARYEDILLPFAKSSQGSSYAMQLFNPQTAWGITLRNTIFRCATWAKLDRLALAASSVVGFTEKKVPNASLSMAG
ncbi:FAD/NAD(P)-binding domain-containing protein [Hyaloscypha variabilis F]|uniref:FAD/NAD(P)-binding domain-containing protein n=1 Tax=Hyaloscypha variabilis (strain UAMH 11265 / GT02V1 / F) TaxID=1149755 RepID=A0A2J6R8Q9_HYAVF|nr:FAD/NAD(P)-binding domain-containing protein [Hyaloscypha variabilis F]